MQVSIDDHPSSERPLLQRRGSQHFSYQAFAILVLSAVQSVSGVCLSLLHAYRQARETIRKVNQSKGVHPADDHSASTEGAHSGGRETPEAQDATPLAVPRTPALPGALSVPQDLQSAKTVPPSPPSSESESFMSPRSQSSSTPPDPAIASVPAPIPPPTQIPNFTHPPLTFLLTLLTPPPPSSHATTSPPTTQPHTTARALAHVLTLLASLAAPFLARLLPYLLYTHALSTHALASGVRSARRALFPEGWPATPPPDPTLEEQAELRARLCRRLVDSVPSKRLSLRS